MAVTRTTAQNRIINSHSSEIGLRIMIINYWTDCDSKDTHGSKVVVNKNLFAHYVDLIAGFV